VIVISLLIESLIERIEYIELKWVGGERGARCNGDMTFIHLF